MKLIKKFKNLSKKLKLKPIIVIKEIPTKITFEKKSEDFGKIGQEEAFIEFYKFLINREKKLLMSYDKEGVELLKLVIRDFILKSEKAKFNIKKFKNIF